MKNPLSLFVLLCVLFLGYTFVLYTDGGAPQAESGMAPSAGMGKLVWQKYNCQACHQLYGLGGYLGPDLTNVYSKIAQNTVAIEAIIRNGNKLMPAYAMDSAEMANLMAFLMAMDHLPYQSDPRKFKSKLNGMTVYEP